MEEDKHSFVSTKAEERGRCKEEEFMKKLQQMMEEEKMRIPIAQGLPWTTDKPECLVKPLIKESTRPVDLLMHSNIRAVERSEFDHQWSSRSAGGSGPPSKAPSNQQNVTNYSYSHVGATLKASFLKPAPLRPGPYEQCTGNHSRPPRISQTRNNENGISNSIPDPRGEDGINDLQHHEREAIPSQGNPGETQNKTEFGIGGHGKDHQEGNCMRIEPRNAEELKDKYHGRNLSNKHATVGQSPKVSIIKMDREKLKAAFARMKARGDVTYKVDPMDELERELEDVEVLDDSEKTKGKRKQSWSKPSRGEHEKSLHINYGNKAEGAHWQAMKGRSLHGDNFGTDEVDQGDR